jgi:hypothetical protein
VAQSFTEDFFNTPNKISLLGGIRKGVKTSRDSVVKKSSADSIPEKDLSGGPLNLTT